jgi:hypothetical protein
MKILKMFAPSLLAFAVFHVPALGQQPAPALGKSDLTGMLEAAPGIPVNVESATAKAYGPNAAPYAKNQLDTAYDPFFKRAAAAHDVLKNAVAAHAKSAPKDPATLQKQAMAQANSNPIVSGMGGVDKIQQMSPEERQAAARQSAAAMQQNIVTGNGRNSPEMQAMMQRVMSDPSYRAKLSSMSEQEQRVEIQKNMGAIAPQTAEQHQKAQQSLQAGNEMAQANAVRAEIQQMMQRLGQIEVEWLRKDQAISNTPGNHNQIMEEIGAKMAKVPVIELGEYGHDKDPVQVQALELECAKRDRDRAAQELPERIKLYQQRKAQYQELVNNYQAWLKQNQGRINTTPIEAFHNVNTELSVAGYEDALIGLSENLAKYSMKIVGDTAGYEMGYRNKAANHSTSTVARTTKPKK